MAEPKIAQIAVGGELPPDAKIPSELLPAGVDSQGLGVYFGFKFSDGSRVLLNLRPALLSHTSDVLQMPKDGIQPCSPS